MKILTPVIFILDFLLSIVVVFAVYYMIHVYSADQIYVNPPTQLFKNAK